MANLMSPRIPFREFAAQYLAGNLLSAVAAIVVGEAASQAGQSAVVTALAATIANDIAWYVYLLAYNLHAGDSAGEAVRHLVSDFGLAEVLDTFLVRPGLFYVAPMITHNQASGILAGTIVADIFYTAIALNRQRHRTTA